MLGYQNKSADNLKSPPRPGAARPEPAGLFDSVFHGVDEAIAIAGRDRATAAMVIVDVNRQFERKIGCLGQEIRGKSLSAVFPGVNELVEQILANPQDSSSPASLELAALRADGTSFAAELTVKPFSSPTSSGEFVVILRSPGRSATTADDEMANRFLSSMSHDLRTPLNGILGFSEIMMTEMLGPLGKECYRNYAQDIHGAGRDLLRVIDGLLDVTSAISGQSLPQRRERFTLRACIAAAVAETRPKANLSAVRLNIRQARDLPDMLGDYGRLLAAFTFVIANAINRTPRNGAVSVSVRRADGNMAEFTCRDAGPHLSPAALSHIFEPFRVSSDAYIANTTDFGVGFSLVRLTAEQHGGSVSVQSNPQSGLELTIRLPLATLA